MNTQFISRRTPNAIFWQFPGRPKAKPRPCNCRPCRAVHTTVGEHLPILAFVGEPGFVRIQCAVVIPSEPPVPISCDLGASPNL